MNETRTEYRELSEDEKQLIAACKARGQEYIDFLNNLPKSREISLALTNAEQSVMWAVKGLTA